MAKLELKRKSELSRKEVADRLVALGRALGSGSDVELEWGSETIKVVVADNLQWELEIEVDGDETEIEIEIKWRDDPTDPPSAPERPVPVKAARRGRPRKVAAK